MKLKRTLGASALAFLALAANAQSDVSVYGLVDAMAYRKQLAGEARSMRVDSGGLSTSFWGVRGREDLGDGLVAQFDLSAFFRVDTGANGRSDTDPAFARSSWVGLQAPWGSVRLGRQRTLAFINLVKYSALGGSSAFNPSFMHNYQSSATQPVMTGSGAADSTWNNGITYTSPSASGFTGAVFYVPSEASVDGRRLGGSLSYASGPLSLGLAGEKISGMALNFSKPPANVRIDSSQIVSLGASYDMTAVKIFAQTLQTKLRNPTTNIDLTTTNIGAAIPAGSGQFLVSHGATRKTQTTQAEVTRRTTTLAYEYNLSKRTDLYGVILRDSATGLASGTGFAVGVRHGF